MSIFSVSYYLVASILKVSELQTWFMPILSDFQPFQAISAEKNVTLSGLKIDKTKADDPYAPMVSAGNLY